MFERAKALCASFLDLGIPGFDLAVYHHGTCVLRHMDGFSDREKRIPINGQERWYIYSCSKPITCTAALQLWEQGRFSLEDPLSRYLPEFGEMMVGDRKAENPILIRHLFEMTAGFSYDVASASLTAFQKATNGRCPTRETMIHLAKEPLLFEPGTQWYYSLCHDVLAALVEVLSGQTFEQYVQEHIFHPLGMTRSTFLLPADEKESLARLYACDEAKGEITPCGQDNSYILGSEYALTDKDGARSFFNRMRQKFIDWNYTEFESEAFAKAEAEIDAMYALGQGKISQKAELLLKDGE